MTAFLSKASITERYPEYLNMAEAAVQFIEPSFAKRASSPVKFAEALAMGVPVIANEGIGDVAALLKEAQAGVVVKSWNDLEELAQQWDHNRFDRSAIRDYAVRNFGLEVGVQQYFNVYNSTSHA